MSSKGKPHPYYAQTYTQHIIRASGNVEVWRGCPFTEDHAREAGKLTDWPGLSLKRPPDLSHHYQGLPLYAATSLVESWNNRHNNLRNHFPRFFYTVE